MFNVGPSDGFGVFAVVGDHYCDRGIVSPHAVDEILKFVVAQERLGRDGDQGADIILCKDHTTVGENSFPSSQTTDD